MWFDRRLFLYPYGHTANRRGHTTNGVVKVSNSNLLFIGRRDMAAKCMYCASTSHTTIEHEGWLKFFPAKSKEFNIEMDGTLLKGSFLEDFFSKEPVGPSLKQRVANDINELLKDIEWEEVAPKELPTGDLSSYETAYEHALRTCPHDALNNTMYMREWQCLDCNKIFGLKEVLAMQSQKRRFPW